MSTEIYLPLISESVVGRHRFSAIENGSRLGLCDTSVEDCPQVAPAYDASPWCASKYKRSFDLLCVVPALLLISPLLALVAIAVRLTSSGPVIFRQQRAGRNRELFTIYKFRTMVENSESIGPGHTVKGDPRITPIGNFLRRFKLDELPQLYNVLRGEMSLVGPRPKIPHHDQTTIACRPGVTGAATLAFRGEQHLLAEVPPGRLESFYQEHIVPKKLQLDADYMNRATLLSDICVLVATVLPGGDNLTYQDFCSPSNRFAESNSAQAQVAIAVQSN